MTSKLKHTEMWALRVAAGGSPGKADQDHQGVEVTPPPKSSMNGKPRQRNKVSENNCLSSPSPIIRGVGAPRKAARPARCPV